MARDNDTPHPSTLHQSSLSEDEMALLNAEAPARDPGTTATEASADSIPPDGGRALVIGAIERDAQEVRSALENRGFHVTSVPEPRPAETMLSETSFHLVVLTASSADLKVLGWLRLLAAHAAVPPVLLAVRRPTPSLVFQAVKAGADYVVVLPLKETAVERMVALTKMERAA
jgi:PleD family two-component response regulator